MYYMGEIIALVMFCVGFVAGCSGIYLVVRSFHRKWRYQDLIHQNNLRKELMAEMNIGYEVDEHGVARPKIVHNSTIH
jgi:hypothetical protein